MESIPIVSEEKKVELEEENRTACVQSDDTFKLKVSKNVRFNTCNSRSELALLKELCQNFKWTNDH